jgi:serine/threonine protein kinase
VEPLARLGRYRLVERIGGGATSSVYSAHDERMDRAVAIKMIVSDLQDDPEARERFLREARITSQILHPNIVTVLDIGEDAGRPYLAMELLRGKRLGEHLRGGGSPGLAAKLNLLRQLCAGLQAAHEQSVVHRDIKPNNLFVEPDGTLKILDFGLARLKTSTLTASGQIVGTPDFMSPEQASGEVVDARSDIFSAAAVGYLLLTGQPPFTRGDLRRTLEALLHEDPAPIANAPSWVGRVIARGLAKNPADRYQSCADMLADLKGDAS